MPAFCLWDEMQTDWRIGVSQSKLKIEIFETIFFADSSNIVRQANLKKHVLIMF